VGTASAPTAATVGSAEVGNEVRGMGGRRLQEKGPFEVSFLKTPTSAVANEIRLKRLRGTRGGCASIK
jgi:hypothetical protein